MHWYGFISGLTADTENHVRPVAVSNSRKIREA